MTQAGPCQEESRWPQPPFPSTIHGWLTLSFSDPRLAWLWLPLRVWLGWQWLDAGRHKLADPRWMETGEAIRAFWKRAAAIPEQGRPLAAYEWYREAQPA